MNILIDYEQGKFIRDHATARIKQARLTLTPQYRREHLGWMADSHYEQNYAEREAGIARLRDAENMMLKAMREHGLTAQGWRFDWDNAKVRFGQCRHRDKTITMSRHLVRLNTADHVQDTVLHEIAHALVGTRHGHDWVWKYKARSIGADPTRCYDGVAVKQPSRPYIGTCPNCKREVHRHQRRKIACGECCTKYNHGRFDRAYMFTWRKA